MHSPRRPGPPDLVVRILQALLIVGALAAWETSATLNHQVHFFFSQPTAIAERILEWIGTRNLWVDAAVTLAETVLGFVGGVVLGLVLAFLCYGSRLAERVLMPFFSVANAMPRIVFGPIFVLWFGLGLTSKALLGLSIVTFIVLFATFQGLKEVDPALILRVRLLGGSSVDVARHVLIPSALSWVFTSLRTGMGLALVGAVVGEYSGASEGLGHRIDFAEGMFDSTGIFAGLTLLSVMVVLLDGLLEMVEQRFRTRSAEGLEEPSKRRFPSRRPALLAALALVLALAARSTWLSHQPPPVPLMRVTLASAGQTLMGNLPSALAASQGWFRDQGLNVEVQDFKGGAPAAKALIGGSADFASIALDHALKARAQGADLVMLVAYDRYPGLSLVVDSRYRDRVRTVADLRGRAVGVTSLGSGSHLALQALLWRVGMKPEDVQVVSVGTGTMPAALEQGSIQAAMHYDPFVSSLGLDGKAFILVDLTTEETTHWLYGTDYPYLGLVTRRDVIRSHPDTCQKMVNAIVVAQRFLQNRGPQEVGRALPADFDATSAAYQKALAHTGPSFSPDGVVDDAEVGTILRSLKETGVVPASMEVLAQEVVDLSFLRRAHAR